MSEFPVSQEQSLEKRFVKEWAWLSQKIAEGNPEFRYAKMEEFEQIDFEFIRRFFQDMLTDTEVRVRQNDLDLDHPLNSSQKELNAYLLRQIMAKLTQSNPDN